MAIENVLKLARVIPVLTIEDVEDAVPLCSALAEGGLPVLEITLRTPAAIPSVEMAVKALPDATIGVGTLLDETDFAKARDAGAKFAVSPGLNMDLVAASVVEEIDYLPGIQTSSEAMSAYRSGLRALKFFPAKAAGGTYGLAQLAPLYPGLVFCPTGGISLDEAPAYLDQPNVACVGGSFASPNDLVTARDWTAITELARHAAAL
ncbi:MAG: keto-deoxy-phosphogluconate aldolase [Rhodospirillaceae bacterium]|nr:keto-deoxy-phosphogluconate aldolase [Rhodospirillaceae bacterium]